MPEPVCFQYKLVDAAQRSDMLRDELNVYGAEGYQVAAVTFGPTAVIILMRPVPREECTNG